MGNRPQVPEDVAGGAAPLATPQCVELGLWEAQACNPSRLPSIMVHGSARGARALGAARGSSNLQPQQAARHHGAWTGAQREAREQLRAAQESCPWHEAGWLEPATPQLGGPVSPWCPKCGTGQQESPIESQEARARDTAGSGCSGRGTRPGRCIQR